MPRHLLTTPLMCLALAVVPCHAAPTEPPRAAVWETVDPVTHATGGAELLESAGFRAASVTASTFSDAYATDLILLGSFLSEDPSYAEVIRRHADRLLRWVAAGGVLVQMTQRARTEAEPRFLPTGLSARRDDVSWNLLRTERPDAPLLRGLVIDHPDGARFPLPGHPRGIAATQTFSEFKGWEVLLWSDPQIPYRDAALLEAEHGAGRIVLVAIPLDKLRRPDGTLTVDDPYPLAASTFAANLYDYVSAANTGTLPPPTITDPIPAPPYGFTDGSWSVVVIPDSQFAVHEAPEVLEAQLEWIATSRRRLDLRFVVHEGDVTHTGHRREWRRARRAFDTIEGVVPYAVTTGNHDYARGTPLSERVTEFSRYFGADVAGAQPTFGGVLSEQRPENQYHRFEAGGTSWLVITLEYLPSLDAVEWAHVVLSHAPGDEAILVTHSFVDELDGRIDLDERLRALGRPALPAVYHDGEDLWRELVSRHPNIRLVVSGHVTGDGAGRRLDIVSGRPVHQLLANYQMRRNGGEGWLRVLEFLPDRRTVRVHTYSPWLDRFMTGPQHQFELDLGDPEGTADGG